ncbi:MAG: 2-iminoacetate synthase ThiH, partial [Desulfobulbaceae bacterium]|nr:2-iminoacetate synthase ThiH [Desulfobulbaceae bacterium]
MFVTPDFDNLRQAVTTATAADVLRALKSPRLGKRDLAALLSPAAEPFLGAMASRSAAITEQRFGKTIQIYAPLYVSNLCANRCLYCGFSAENRIERRALTLEEAEAEALLLHKRGFNHLLLVSGEA